MTAKINEEFLALMSVRRRLGAAFTPRRQGPGERAHQIVMYHHLLFMNEICRCFPQEWASLAPALEYLRETAPREPHGLSAFDLSQGYALLTNQDKRLTPFQIPDGAATTDIAAQMFARFKDLYGVFARTTAEEALAKQDELNRKRAWRGRFPSAAGPREACETSPLRALLRTLRGYGAENI